MWILQFSSSMEPGWNRSVFSVSRPTLGPVGGRTPFLIWLCESLLLIVNRCSDFRKRLARWASSPSILTSLWMSGSSTVQWSGSSTRLWANKLKPLFKAMWINLLRAAVDCPAPSPPSFMEKMPPLIGCLVAGLDAGAVEGLGLCPATIVSGVAERPIVSSISSSGQPSAVAASDVLDLEQVSIVVESEVSVRPGSSIFADPLLLLQLLQRRRFSWEGLSGGGGSCCCRRCFAATCRSHRCFVEFLVLSDRGPLDVALLPSPMRVCTRDLLLPTPTRSNCRAMRFAEKVVALLKFPLRKLKVKSPSSSFRPFTLDRLSSVWMGTMLSFARSSPRHGASQSLRVSLETKTLHISYMQVFLLIL